ncbi:MAG: DUF2924 domain-containing protein [Polyangiaceae bacterium]
MNAATLSAQEARKLLGDLPAELRAVDSMTTGELRAKHAELFGHATATRNRTYLRRKIKYRIQELALGGLSDRALARAAALAEAGRLHHGHFGARRPGGAEPPVAPVTTGLAPGMRLRRTFQGAEHEVLVLPDGLFEYAGRPYGSLSTIAKEITGTVWNGKLFFGLKTRAKKGAE